MMNFALKMMNFALKMMIVEKEQASSGAGGLSGDDSAGENLLILLLATCYLLLATCYLLLADFQRSPWH